MMIDPRVGRRTSGLQYFSRHLLASAAVVALVLGQAANANPVGGKVTSGSATISTPSSNTLQIDQSTKIVIINWQSFNIGSGETTKFVQPGASSVAVNRIGGNDPSQILGSLLANGKVVLINGNGILFGKGATVNVGSLIATTSDAPDADISSGKATFDKAGNPNAQIVNQGSITASTGGLVGLIAPAVSNSGLIAAKLGTVTLGASNVFTLDFTGDGLVSFPVDGNVVAAAIGKSGKPVEALVVNNGKISGGTVVLTARAAANLVTNVISMKGEIVATQAHQVGGKVVLDGGDSGVVSVAGTIDASAGENGNGGTLKVVGQTTQFNGTATAKGGSQSGDGGQIETSGHVLDVTGAKIDTSAANGVTGTWTLDPYNVTISAGTSATDSCSAGTCTPSGNNSVLNVTTLQTALATSNVTVMTGSAGSQAGNITVAAPLTWSAHTLTLDAYHSINIDAAVSATGTAGLTLKTNDGGSGGDLYFTGGSISFANTSEVLMINGKAYKLLNSMSALQNINASNTALQGHYALVTSLNASSTLSWTPIGTNGAGNIGNSGYGFTGTFEGLGHTISNLTINLPLVNYVGLFGASSGTIRDIGLIGGSVTGSDHDGELLGYNGSIGTISNAYATGKVSGSGYYVGGLVGHNRGTISSAYATGTVKGTGAYVGGLVGYSDGTISNAYATGVVSSTYNDVGGLVGESDGTISNAHATGAVSGFNDVGGLVGESDGGTISNAYAKGKVSSSNDGGDIGGLVGYSNATISNVHATGAVSGTYDCIGGLVGYNNNGAISNAYATGAVSGGSSSDWVGGLVGKNYGGTISNAYATGTLSGTYNFIGGLVGENGGTIEQSYATVAVSGTNDVGGLVGYNSGTISESYATGAVNGFQDVGGLVGKNYYTITDSYATGAVSGAYNFIGGLVGESDGGTISNAYATGAVNNSGNGTDVGSFVGYNNGGIITNGYWDTQTSGQSIGLGADNYSQSGNVTGKTTVQLQGSSGFNASVWGTGSGLFPYFLWQYPTTPQAISGFAYSNAGVTPLASTASGAVTVSALVGGKSRGNATTGANGYYYLLVPHGTFSGMQQLLTYLKGGTVKANTYVQSPTGNVTNANLYGGYLRLLSGVGTTSTMLGGLSTALGSNTGSNFLYSGSSAVSGTTVDIESSNSTGLTIDSALNIGTGKFILKAAGPLAESGIGTITATTLTGASHGAVTLNGANVIAKLSAFTTNNGKFALTDAALLTTTGTVNAGTNTITLKTTGGTSNGIAIKSHLTTSGSAGVVSLTSAGNVTETIAGAIVTHKLNVTAQTGITLTSPSNNISVLGTHTTVSGPNNINL